MTPRYTPLPTCYNVVKLGSSATNGARKNRREPQNWRAPGPRPFGDLQLSQFVIFRCTVCAYCCLRATQKTTLAQDNQSFHAENVGKPLPGPKGWLSPVMTATHGFIRIVLVCHLTAIMPLPILTRLGTAARVGYRTSLRASLSHFSLITACPLMKTRTTCHLAIHLV